MPWCVASRPELRIVVAGSPVTVDHNPIALLGNRSIALSLEHVSLVRQSDLDILSSCTVTTPGCCGNHHRISLSTLTQLLERHIPNMASNPLRIRNKSGWEINILCSDEPVSPRTVPLPIRTSIHERGRVANPMSSSARRALRVVLAGVQIHEPH